MKYLRDLKRLWIGAMFAGIVFVLFTSYAIDRPDLGWGFVIGVIFMSYLHQKSNAIHKRMREDRQA